jgi:hypothetical protein
LAESSFAKNIYRAKRLILNMLSSQNKQFTDLTRDAYGKFIEGIRDLDRWTASLDKKAEASRARATIASASLKLTAHNPRLRFQLP